MLDEPHNSPLRLQVFLQASGYSRSVNAPSIPPANPSGVRVWPFVLGRHAWYMTYPKDPPPYEPYPDPGQQPPATALVCPKCHGAMRTYERNGIQLEQCGNCRGLFLDFGELEQLTQMEGRFLNQPPPMPGYGPAWGKHGDRRYRKGGLAGLFFSS